MMLRESRRSVLILLMVTVLILPLCPCIRPGDQTDFDPPHTSQWDRERLRLFFTSQKVARLQQRLEQRERFQQAWLRINERVDRQLEEQLVSKEYAEIIPPESGVTPRSHAAPAEAVRA